MKFELNFLGLIGLAEDGQRDSCTRYRSIQSQRDGRTLTWLGVGSWNSGNQRHWQQGGWAGGWRLDGMGLDCFVKGVRLDPLKPLGNFEQQRSCTLFALQTAPSDVGVQDRIHL